CHDLTTFKIIFMERIFVGEMKIVGAPMTLSMTLRGKLLGISSYRSRLTGPLQSEMRDE
ncbi:hypothetical protein L9F63_011847, partial [Diploptera punctata]